MNLTCTLKEGFQIILYCGGFLIAGCSSSSNPTEKSVTPMLSSYLAGMRECLPIMHGFPYTEYLASKWDEMEPLEHAGLVLKSDILVPSPEEGPEHTRGRHYMAKKFDLSQAGKEVYVERSGWNGAIPNLCLGKRQLERVDSISPPTTNFAGISVVKVSFKYKILAERWIESDKEVSKVFAKNAQDALGEVGKVKGDTISLVLTKKGWVIESLAETEELVISRDLENSLFGSSKSNSGIGAFLQKHLLGI